LNEVDEETKGADSTDKKTWKQCKMET